MPNNKRFRRNMLVAYHGGGYDGCIWEWNYAYFDRNGEFHNIFSSGVLGCNTEEKLREKLRNQPDEVELTNLNSERARNKFADNEGLNGLMRCVKWFNEFDQTIKLKPKCDCCGDRFQAIEGHGEDWRGVGGIEMAPSQIICQDCFDQYSCTGCNEYYGPDHKFAETLHLSHACTYCVADEARRLVQLT